MLLNGFIGGSAQAASRSVDVERSINLITLVSDTGTPKVQTALQNAPGCEPWLGLPSGAVRGLYTLNGQRAWAVAGGFFYELFANQTAIEIGVVSQDNRPITWACNGANGNQLMFCSGRLGYVFDLVTGTLTQIVADGFPLQCAMVAECSGYGLALTLQSNQFNVSNPLDYLAWDGLDFGRVQTNDPIVAMLSANNLVYLLGGQQSQVWYPSGDTFPFSLMQNAQMQTGTSSAFGAIVLGVAPNATVVFPSRNAEGQGIMYALSGYSPQTVSSFAVSTILQTTPRLADMIAWTYQSEGHTFGIFQIPGNDTTWCFDVTAPPGMNWAERGIWDSAAYRWTPHIGRCHAFAFGKHLVGSRTDGTIYEMHQGFYADRIVA